MEEEISNNLRLVLNQEYKIWNMEKITLHSFSIQEPLIRISKNTFHISEEAKEKFSTLCDNEFFEAYDKNHKVFISKAGKMRLLFDDGSSRFSETGRIHLYTDGRMGYSRKSDSLVDYKSLILFSDFGIGRFTKAVR